MKKNYHTTSIEGQIEHITYFNEKTQYTIARLKPSNLSARITVVGYLAGIGSGENLKIKGTWVTHPKYGQQFRIQSYEVTLPAAVDGIRKYLNSGIIKGIGPSLATKLVNAFGVNTLEIIENTPERLIEVDGIGEAKAAMVKNAWKEHHALRSLMHFGVRKYTKNMDRMR
jgi:exodeoxyribonuclease V alpha subunit